MNLDNIRTLNEAVNALVRKAHKENVSAWWENLSDITDSRIREAEFGYGHFYDFLYERFELLRDMNSPTIKIATGIIDPRYDSDPVSIAFVISEYTRKPGIYLCIGSDKEYRLEYTVCETACANYMGYMDCEHFFSFLKDWDSIQASEFDEAFCDKCISILADRASKANELLSEDK